MLQNSVFVKPNSGVDETVDLIFVSDSFDEVFEPSTTNLIADSPLKIQCIKSADVNMSVLFNASAKRWIFANFSQLNPELIPSIVANLKYSIIEYDYKFCRHRSPAKHAKLSQLSCDCPDQLNGKLVSAFYYGAESLWWSSEKQKEKYINLFPFLSEKDNVVLSSVFSKNSLGTLLWLQKHALISSDSRSGWLILNINTSQEEIENAKEWCRARGEDYQIISDFSHNQLLDKLARSIGVVYLPSYEDPCPHVILEAKLLGCKLHLNDNVEHVKESWFDVDDLSSISDYLYSSAEIFWKAIQKNMNNKHTISGYTTTYNCVKQEYPFKECIKSMLQFCDEVCVVDGGSTDGTYEKLCDLAETEPRVKVKVVSRDWNHIRHAVFDGMQKAEARDMCTGDFCWQMDSDEIVRSSDAEKIIGLVNMMPPGINVLSLPVVDFWGSKGKVRLDTTPWKWRLSRNNSDITHGIPAELRMKDENGHLYASRGTDGCDMISRTTGERLDHASFVSADSEAARHAALQGNSQALHAYQEWFSQVTSDLPSVMHYSWHDLNRKIKTYKNYWSRHWESLYNIPQHDTADNNMFFDKPWSQVSDEEIKELAEKLEGIGGWIWNSKWDGTITPHLELTSKDNV